LVGFQGGWLFFQNVLSEVMMGENAKVSGANDSLLNDVTHVTTAMPPTRRPYNNWITAFLPFNFELIF
jgi:hypothetical protein